MFRIIKSIFILLIVGLSFISYANAAGYYLNPNTYVDTIDFDNNYLYYESASWMHTIPTNFDFDSAQIDVDIYVHNFSQTGTLDLFSSNTNTFDYGNVYNAPSKDGFIGHLFGVVAYQEWDQVSFDLSSVQLGWLSDDGHIYGAMIGPGYFMTDFSAQFYLDSATLTVTSSAVPIPPAFMLLGSGLIGIVGIRRKLRK